MAVRQVVTRGQRDRIRQVATRRLGRADHTVAAATIKPPAGVRAKNPGPPLRTSPSSLSSPALI